MTLLIDTRKIDVLDHGYVRLVSFTQPVEDFEEIEPSDWTGDLEIVRNARVSYNADWRDADQEKDRKLVNYLYKHHHTSPFEAMVFTFEVKAPIFVMRQWHRHRTWSYNEISARYSVLESDFYVPDLDQITTQSASNKQMRTNTRHPLADSFRGIIEASNRASCALYEQMIQQGCPRELARTVLPLGIYTRMFATVDLHNLLHFLRLRSHEHAQYEIRVYADALAKLIEPIVPFTMAAFRESLKEAS